MPCPKCERKRYKEKVIKKGKQNFLIRVCLACGKEYGLILVRKSKATNLWVEIEEENEEDK
jgi:uncharacterized Zn finger protein